MGSVFLGVIRLTGYVLGSLLVLVVQGGLLKIPPLRDRYWLVLPPLYHRFCSWILGIEIVVKGDVSTSKPTLWVANHSSYMDIPVLGSLLLGSFVAKSEVGTWPLFGTLSRLQKTIFINRRPGDADAQRASLNGRLEQGDSVILFPEGTSSDGNRVLPFKTALFAVANMKTGPNGETLAVQPVSITCTHLDNVPMGRDLRPFYAWYGDMDLAPHLWQLAKLGKMRVVVELHPVVRLADVGSRKELGQFCEQQVAAGVSRAIAGRDMNILPALADIDDAKQTKAA